MMAQKHLHELLEEDQEPFLLKNYIADRRCRLKGPSPNTQLQTVKKRKLISKTPTLPQSFCKNACFLSFHDSPDLRKSPLFDFSSPVKSPCRSPNAIFLHIPAKTAAILLEASLRIQKQPSASKSKTQNKKHGLGLFGSIVKRLTHWGRNRENIGGDRINVSVKDILKWDSSVCRTSNESLKRMHKKNVAMEDKSASDKSACETSIWSESNEERSLDLDFSSSSQSVDSEVIDLLTKRREDADFSCCDKQFCESPFCFVLQRSPSLGRRTPEFTSPAVSPSRHKREEKEISEEGALEIFQEEEEKEQCSPVSVLDPPFVDDDDRHEDDDMDEDEHEHEHEDGNFDNECSYAIVQRAKQQLLHKLRRFEKLAGLDPIELEKRMFEQEGDDDYEHTDDDLEEEDAIEDELEASCREENVDGFFMEVLHKSHFQSLRQIPEDMKRLVSDLILEDRREQDAFDSREEAVNRVCKRLESCKEVESNTIDMMVEQDLRKELEGWKRNQQQAGETAQEIELAIFGLLIQELSEELVSLDGN